MPVTFEMTFIRIDTFLLVVVLLKLVIFKVLKNTFHFFCMIIGLYKIKIFSSFGIVCYMKSILSENI
jgi:hypothetical protein